MRALAITVALAACGRPRAPDEPRRAPPVTAQPDAAVAVAEPDAAPVEEPVEEEPCSDPSQCIEGRVLAFQREPGVTIVTVGAGSSRGVTYGHEAFLVDSNRRIPVKILDVHTDDSRVATTLVGKDLVNLRRVRFMAAHAAMRPGAPPFGAVRVIGIQENDGVSVVRLSGGTQAGWKPGMRGRLLDARGSPVRGTDFLVASTAPTHARVQLALTPDQASRVVFAELVP